MGNRVQVKFAKDYVASRGNSISGAKGDEKIYPASDDLDALIKKGIVKKVKDIKEKKKTAKKTPAAKRETAKGKRGAEKS